eukprot:GDKJ01022450.1.p1 GENE.GDKJ01022450.1~~GDKJ01022450.1.p1  ORF type:complete len:495 (+),score=113.67 GDKJ01022450.1:347-1831(+)
MSFVFRVDTKSGRIRVQVPNTSKLSDLKLAIEKLTQTSPSNQSLSKEDGTLLSNNDSLLSSLGLSTGDILTLSVKDGSLNVVADTSLLAKAKMTTKDLPQAPPQPSPDVSAATSGNQKQPENGDDEDLLNKKEEGGKPLFDSFDQFLKDRIYNIGDLAFNRSYKPFKMERGRMNKMPQPITLKFQRYRHVDHLEIMNVPEMNSFVSYWRDELGMHVHRAGWMYGYYSETKHYKLGIKAVVEAIYEPPQNYVNGAIKLEKDTFLATVDAVAERLGLERIGWIFTHDERKQPLTSKEILVAGQLQLASLQTGHFTGYPVSKLVTCTISPDPSNNGAPVPNAYMVSDLGVALIRDETLAEPEDADHFSVRPAADNFELPSKFLERGKETSKFDSTWMLVKVNNSAPVQPRCMLKRTTFPRLNRLIHPTEADVRKFLSAKFGVEDGVTPSECDKYSDFHFLLYIAQCLGKETAFHFCDAIRNRTPLSEDGKSMLALMS